MPSTFSCRFKIEEVKPIAGSYAVYKESTGKSALAAALTGQCPTSTNIQGSTIACDRSPGRFDASLLGRTLAIACEEYLPS
ncbi:MAG: hypothetical protein ACFB14_12870 [Leptolyngbyaceae cyanobacterium]